MKLLPVYPYCIHMLCIPTACTLICLTCLLSRHADFHRVWYMLSDHHHDPCSPLSAPPAIASLATWYPPLRQYSHEGGSSPTLTYAHQASHTYLHHSKPSTEIAWNGSTPHRNDRGLCAQTMCFICPTWCYPYMVLSLHNVMGVIMMICPHGVMGVMMPPVQHADCVGRAAIMIMLGYAVNAGLRAGWRRHQGQYHEVPIEEQGEDTTREAPRHKLLHKSHLGMRLWQSIPQHASVHLDTSPYVGGSVDDMQVVQALVIADITLMRDSL